MRIVKVLLVVLCAGLSACNATSKKKEPPVLLPVVATVQGNFIAPSTKYFDSTAIAVFIDSFPLFKKVNADLYKFYRGRNFSFAWFSDNGMIEQAGNLYNKIKNVDEEGVQSSKLAYQQEFNNVMDDIYRWSENDNSKIVKAELMLTAQYLQYAKIVWVGVLEKESLALQWLLPRKKVSYSQTLDSLLSGKDILENPPVFRQYYLLKDYLKKYRLVEKADTIKVPLTKSTLKNGDSSNTVSAARYKLFLLGDLKDYTPLAKFDDVLEEAIRHF